MTFQVEPASPPEVALYQPYYALARRQYLALAVGLYKKGSLEGQRPIEGDKPVPFLASWPVLPLPSDLTVVQVIFDQDPDLTYQLSLANYEFVDYLIDVVAAMQRGQPPNFTTAFYKKLMRYED
ncbi:type IV pilus biogenesis protein EbsA [Synechococcus sp. H65.1]|uniref:type IV pilus biogenesis protein EbsA n=1 Tax=unclassified Synechococcus TaxID=2626047 RepID=UPI0039C35AD2